MDTFRKLFVAIDFSPDSDEALRQAHERAESTGAQLAVCHIVPNHLRSNLLFPQISRVAALKVPLELNQFANTVSTRVSEITGRTEDEFELIVDDGTPQALILSHAEEWKADIIFMGSHGETDAADALLGSITNSVLRHAHCPVLVVRPGKIDEANYCRNGFLRSLIGRGQGGGEGGGEDKCQVDGRSQPGFDLDACILSRNGIRRKPDGDVCRRNQGIGIRRAKAS